MSAPAGMTATEAQPAPRLVIAQAPGLLVEALEAFLGAAGLSVLARCTRFDDLEPCLRRHAPDIALIDTEMPPGDVSVLVDAAWRGLRDGHAVLLAPGVDSGLALLSMQLAIDGVVLKCAPACDVVDALRRIAVGFEVFPAGWLAAARRGAVSAHALSDRQYEVLELLAQGLPNEVIAERLFISRNTVKFHVAAIYQRLDVSNRVQAARALASLRALS